MLKNKYGLGDRVFDIINNSLIFIVMGIFLYPLLYVVSASFSDPALVSRGDVILFPKGLTLAAYERVVADPFIWKSYWNTIVYTVVQTALTLLFTALLAYPLSKKFIPGRRMILLLVAFTMLFDGGLVPRFLVVQNLGLINTMWALIIPRLITTWYLFIMRTFFEGIPQDLEDAATIDGCGPLRILYQVVLPLSLPVLATVGLYTAVNRWNSFFDALIYLNSKALYPLQIHLRNLILANSAAAQAESIGGEEMIILETVKYATIVVATVPILCVYPFLQKYFVKGSMIGSLKG